MTASALIGRYGKGTDSDATDTLVAGPLSGGASIRRLTPVECERLQAFPDGWTALGPDSRRYAALGDAVTVTVAEWAGRRILEAS